MRILSSFCAAFLCIVPAVTVFSDFRPEGELKKTLWEYSLDGFSDDDYAVGVELLMQAYEQMSGSALEPGDLGKVGLKIYTASGPGLSTPPSLVRGVITSLEIRGFNRSDLFIVDQNEINMRNSGYLPSGTKRAEFEDVPVYVLESKKYYDESWYYDSNLPSREKLLQYVNNAKLKWETDPDERKSFLAAPLIEKADFWINLPMVSDEKAIGVNGALANATLWNVSNNYRFFASPANAPVAIAEIAGIPELRSKWAFTILTLENYQFMNGPRFNSIYTKSEKKLWLSPNPVAMDYLMYQRINQGRKSFSFPEFPTEPPLFQYAKAVGLGRYELKDLNLLRIKADPVTVEEESDTSGNTVGIDLENEAVVEIQVEEAGTGEDEGEPVVEGKKPWWKRLF